MAHLNELSLTQLLAELSSGNCSAEEIVQDCFSAIDARNDELNIFIYEDRERVLEQARKTPAGKLGGLPIGIKDLLNVQGQPCRCSSDILKGYTAPYTATAVAKLEAEGAIPFGRVNMDEFAMGSSNENSQYGPCRNPVNPDYVPGGSSGGSAAAVAANMVPAALGSDTGGSIRQPASFCGCVGVKPTYGLVSRYGLTAFASSLDQIGPLTRTVEDAALLMEMLCGHDPADSTSLQRPVPAYREALTGDIKGLRIGVPKEYFGEGIDPEVEQAVRKSIADCESQGADIVEVELPHSEYAIATYYIIATAEASANLARFDGIRYGQRIPGEDPMDVHCKSREAGFGTEVKRRIILGTYVLSSGYYDAYYGKAQKVRGLIRHDFDQAFEKCDVIMGPTAPTAAFKIGEKVNDPLEMYLNDILTVPVNLAGNCGISVPCGTTGEGLPIGLQIIAPAFGEETMFRAAYACEK